MTEQSNSSSLFGNPLISKVSRLFRVWHAENVGYTAYVLTILAFVCIYFEMYATLLTGLALRAIWKEPIDLLSAEIEWWRGLMSMKESMNPTPVRSSENVSVVDADDL